MNNLDALTLQLLSSKKKYNKYLENTQPNKSNEIQEFYGKIRKFKYKIIQTLEKYLENPEFQTTTDVDESIEVCFRTLIRHFEILNKEQKSYLNDYDETDSTDEEEIANEHGEDEDEDDEDDKDDKDDKDEDQSKTKASAGVVESTNKKPLARSFWGNQITKTASTNLDAFIKKKPKNE